MWEGAFLAKVADLGGADAETRLLAPDQQPELLEVVKLHQVRGEGDLAHTEFPAMLLCMVHAVGLQGVQGFQAWTKGVPIKGGERGIGEEGMELGKELVLMGGCQEEVIIGITGGRNGASETTHLGADYLLSGLPNQRRQIEVNDASSVVAGAHGKGAPGGEGNREVLGDPDAVDGRFAAGATAEGSQRGVARVCRQDCFAKGMRMTEGSKIRFPDVAIDIGHKNDGIARSLPRSEGGREIAEESITGASSIPKGFQMATMLGIHSLEADLLSLVGTVATDDADAAAGAALKTEPRPTAQTRWVDTRSSNVGGDGARTKEECATPLFQVMVVVDVMGSDGAQGKLGPKPFPERSRFWHLGPVKVGFASSKDVQVHLGDE